MPSGPVKVVVAFHWPKVGKVNIPLSFHAQDGHSYFIKYNRYSDPDASWRDAKDIPKGLMGVAGFFAQAEVAGAIVAIPLMGCAVVTGLVADVSQGVGYTSHSGQAANYIDLFVISSLSSEGVISQVRGYPTGQISKQ